MRGNSSEDLDMEQSSNLLGPQKQADTPDIPFCGCLSIRYYQPYFDVDTEDIQKRISNAFIFCKREQNFLNLIGDKPDVYGPFWIATSLVFSISVASHLNGFIAAWLHGEAWEYNFQSVLTACSIIYGFTGLSPAAIWFVFKQYEPSLKFVTMVCLYGYSLLFFLPTTVICLIPSELASWLALLGAAVTSTLFLLRNIGPFIINQAKKQAALLLGFIGCIQVALMLTMKLYFFYEKS